MKLVRYGRPGHEKPGVIDAEGKLRDLSAIVEDIGPALRNATAKITKSAGSSSGGGRADAGVASESSDPWATSSGGAWAGQSTDEPPF